MSLYDDDDDDYKFEDDHDGVIDPDVFDLSKTKVQLWDSKDRTVTTIRISDPNGVCDMKALLMIEAWAHAKRIELGVHDEHGERH